MMDEVHAGLAASPRLGSSVRLSLSAAERRGHCRGDVGARGRRVAANSSPPNGKHVCQTASGQGVAQVKPGRGSE